MEIIETPGRVDIPYTGWVDFVEHAKRPAPDGRCKSRESGASMFFQSTSFEKAVQLASSGWREGYTEAQRLLERLHHSGHFELANVQGVDLVRDTQGGMVDVGAYLEGVPECMLDFQMVERQSRFAAVEINCGVASGVSKELFFRRGTAVMAFVDLLESQGVRVDLTAHFMFTESGKVWQFTVPVKEASEPLDVDKVAFALCHADTLRRLWFSEAEHLPETLRKQIGAYAGCGYGGHGYQQRDIHLRHPEAVLINGNWEDWKHRTTDKDVVAWVLKQASRFITLTPAQEAAQP